MIARSDRIAAVTALASFVVEIDLEHCPNCGSGEQKIIAANLKAPVIARVLTHVGLKARTPPHAV